MTAGRDTLASQIMVLETVGRSLSTCSDGRLWEIADRLAENGSIQGFHRLLSAAFWNRAVKETSNAT
jgi:hypothetical protein